MPAAVMSSKKNDAFAARAWRLACNRRCSRTARVHSREGARPAALISSEYEFPIIAISDLCAKPDAVTLVFEYTRDAQKLAR